MNIFKKLQTIFRPFWKAENIKFHENWIHTQNILEFCKGLAYRDHWNNKTDTFGNLSLHIKIPSVQSSFLLRSDNEIERETELIML